MTCRTSLLTKKEKTKHTHTQHINSNITNNIENGNEMQTNLSLAQKHISHLRLSKAFSMAMD